MSSAPRILGTALTQAGPGALHVLDSVLTLCLFVGWGFGRMGMVETNG